MNYNIQSSKYEALIPKFISAIEDLNPIDVDKLLADGVHLKILPLTPKNKRSTPTFSIDFEEISKELDECNDRQQCTEILKSRTKFDLIQLARKYELAVDTSWNKERLIERTTERAVGLRLRQEAFSRI